MKRKALASVLSAAALLGSSWQAFADVVADLQSEYRAQGAGEFSAAAGREMWDRIAIDGATGQKRSCASCHTSDLAKGGKHAKTGKAIDPMSPLVNAERLTDPAKIEKWFLRNCKWTYGRECTPQEKGDFLSLIKSP